MLTSGNGANCEGRHRRSCQDNEVTQGILNDLSTGLGDDLPPEEPHNPAPTGPQNLAESSFAQQYAGADPASSLTRSHCSARRLLSCSRSISPDISFNNIRVRVALSVATARQSL